MKLHELFLDEDAKKAKSIVARSKVKKKKHNPPKGSGPYSFRAHMSAGVSGHLMNPTARGGM